MYMSVKAMQIDESKLMYRAVYICLGSNWFDTLYCTRSMAGTKQPVHKQCSPGPQLPTSHRQHQVPTMWGQQQTVRHPMSDRRSV